MPARRTPWLLAILAALLVAPAAFHEALYQRWLSHLGPLPEKPQPLPALVSAAAWAALRESGPREIASRRPWNLTPRGWRAAMAAGHALTIDARVRRDEWTRASYAATLWAARTLSADEALALWLDRAWFADGVRGLRPAALALFGKPLEALAPEEVARLVLLAHHPSWRKHADEWADGRDRLLRTLRARGELDDGALQAALATKVSPAPR